MHLIASLLPYALLLAQQNDGPKSYTMAWAIILPCVILGLLVALRPTKRTFEVKKPKE